VEVVPLQLATNARLLRNSASALNTLTTEEPSIATDGMRVSVTVTVLLLSPTPPRKFDKTTTKEYWTFLLRSSRGISVGGDRM
jgi:hypothetical protein